jgi:hypothetical protein
MSQRAIELRISSVLLGQMKCLSCYKQVFRGEEKKMNQSKFSPFEQLGSMTKGCGVL